MEILSNSTPCRTFYSQIVDLTAAADVYSVISPIPCRLIRISSGWEIKEADSVTVAPTLSAGTNAGADDYLASQTPGGFLTAAAEKLTSNMSAISPLPCNSLDGVGFRVKITNPATATALKGRFYLLAMLMPL